MSRLPVNSICAPSKLGDPVTCLMIDTQRNFLVSGTATGRVTAWAIPHLLLAHHSQLNDTQRSIIQQVQDAVAKNDFPAVPLAKGSDEGIRSVFTVGERIYALVGDVNAKTWASYDGQDYQLVRYRRMHQVTTCAQSYTLQHNANVLVLTKEASEGLMIDLESGEQRAHPFALEVRSLPVSYNTDRLVVVTNTSTAVTGSGAPAERHGQLVTVTNVKNNSVALRLTCNQIDQFYWGFQLVGDLLVYVSNYSCVKAIKLPAMDAATEQMENIPREKVVHRCETGKRILTFTAAFSALSLKVWTLSADRCIRYFVNGELVKEYGDLVGEIGAAGYPHVLCVNQESNMLFYSADDGIYYLDLTA